MTLDHMIQGFLLAMIVRQFFVNRELAQHVFDNEVALYTLAAQCRALANELGYTIVTPSLNEGRM